MFHEKEHELYGTVTSYKFQFCLFFLAGILGDMNNLNRSFQKRQVDVTEVAKTVESITGDLEHRYLDTNASFGGSGNGWLPKFLMLYGKRSGQTVKVRGTDAEGHPINHSYIQHERKMKGHIFKSCYKDCMRLEAALEEEFVESDDEGDEREMDQEIEQSPPRDYSDEEEDNPFLFDGEEGEETYHIDKPLH
ncbi:unnamed protein product [Closterium sp. Naga37s-1]|nr:unnamed protein product [Closterium sp. Naga37s-1]